MVFVPFIQIQITMIRFSKKVADVKNHASGGQFLHKLLRGSIGLNNLNKQNKLRSIMVTAFFLSLKGIS